jgi:3-phosphoshikimate 1-carboxyvinyltransferase
MGARIETTDGHAPVSVTGGRLQCITYEMPVASAQLQTALLLASLGAEGQMILHQPGPARDHTIRLLRGQGADIEDMDGVITFNPGNFIPQPLNFTVPGDMSSAAFLLVAALITPDSSIILQGVNTNDTRAGLLQTLRAMGGQISVRSEREYAGEPVADLLVKSSELSGVTVGGELVVRMIDEFPIFAVAALHAEGTTLVRDAAELRLKESDRIDVVVNEFRKLGANIIPHPDGFEIRGPQGLTGASVRSHRDHRIAMSLAVAGLTATGETVIADADELNESFPAFVETMQELGAPIAWQVE